MGRWSEAEKVKLGECKVNLWVNSYREDVG